MVRVLPGIPCILCAVLQTVERLWCMERGYPGWAGSASGIRGELGFPDIDSERKDFGETKGI